MTRKRRIQKCIGCGKCCGHYLPLSDEDIRRVSAYAQEHGVEPRWTGVDCPWLADNWTCSVYQARPDVCRAYHCDARKAGAIDGQPQDYHVYNTERLFIYGDDTRYDYLTELAAAMGKSSFDVLFEEKGVRQ